MTNQRTTDEKTRAFEMTIDVDAPLDRVWDAWTKPEELTRGFPLTAQVEPGEGGSMTWAWGEGWSGTMRIDAPQPKRLLCASTRTRVPMTSTAVRATITRSP